MVATDGTHQALFLVLNNSRSPIGRIYSLLAFNAPLVFNEPPTRFVGGYLLVAIITLAIITLAHIHTTPLIRPF